MIKLKWGRLVTEPINPAFLSNSVIGKLYKIDGSSVRRLYLKRFQQLRVADPQEVNRSSVSDRPPARQRYGYRFLSQEHIDFLTDQQTLTRWAGKSLWERCILFHRHFGSHRINPTLLRKVYQVHKIKSKKVKQVKLIKPDKELEYENWRIEIREGASPKPQNPQYMEKYRLI